MVRRQSAGAAGRPVARAVPRGVPHGARQFTQSRGGVETAYYYCEDIEVAAALTDIEAAATSRASVGAASQARLGFAVGFSERFARFVPDVLPAAGRPASDTRSGMRPDVLAEIIQQPPCDVAASGRPPHEDPVADGAQASGRNV